MDNHSLVKCSSVANIALLLYEVEKYVCTVIIQELWLISPRLIHKVILKGNWGVVFNRCLWFLVAVEDKSLPENLVDTEQQSSRSPFLAVRFTVMGMKSMTCARCGRRSFLQWRRLWSYDATGPAVTVRNKTASSIRFRHLGIRFLIAGMISCDTERPDAWGIY